MTLFDPSEGAGGGGGVVMAEKRGRGSVMAQAARSNNVARLKKPKKKQLPKNKNPQNKR